MSFTDLSLEVAAEFSGFRGAREYFDSEGYSFRKLGKVERIDPKLLAALKSRYWRMRNAELIQSAGFRAKAAERARAWFRKQLGNAQKAAAMRKKAAERGRLYRRRHGEEAAFRVRRVAADRRKYERIKADPQKYAARLARNAELKRARRAKARS